MASLPALRRPSATGALILDLLALADSPQGRVGGPGARAPGASWSRTEDGGIDDRSRRTLLASGLAPFLCHAARDEVEHLPAAQRNELLGAELTAMIHHTALQEAAKEVVHVCRDLGVPVTLLKGISIADRLYPAGHLRPMGDVDVLVAQRHRDLVQSALVDRGFLPDEGAWDWAHHAAPVCHPESGVWVEVHHALFPAGAELLTNTLFTAASTARLSVPSEFHGLPARRLRDELWLAYVASYWVRDLSMHTVHPSFLVPLLDAVLLLRNAGDRMDWEGMLRWLDNERAIASLTIMLSWLTRHGLAAQASVIVPRLSARQRLVGAVELRLLHTMLDRWLLGGTPPLIGRRATFLWESLLSSRPTVAKLASLPWRIVFPEDVPDRYSLSYLARIARRLAGTSRQWD